MANNIGYKATIDVDWVSFKAQSGVIVSSDGKSIETTDIIPSNLKLVVSKNTGKTRYGSITFIQEGGEVRQIILKQNANKAGIYQDGEPYLDKNKSSILVKNLSGIIRLGVNGGTVKFSATYKKVYSVNKYETDGDGNEIRRFVEGYPILNEEVDITSAATWSVDPRDINGSKIINGILTLGANKSNGSPVFSINATYDGLVSNVSHVTQKPSPISWYFTVKTNNSDTVVYFLSNGTEVKHEIAELNEDSYYYSTYVTSSIETPKIMAYIVKNNTYSAPTLKLYEKGTENELKSYTWNANASGDETEFDAIYRINKITYKTDNGQSNPKQLVEDDVVAINSTVDKTEEIKKLANDTESKSPWLTLTHESADTFTFKVSASTTNDSREGYVDFKYIDNGEMPSAETRLIVSQTVSTDSTNVVPNETNVNLNDSTNTATSNQV